MISNCKGFAIRNKYDIKPISNCSRLLSEIIRHQADIKLDNYNILPTSDLSRPAHKLLSGKHSNCSRTSAN